jgi:hypothetical protein
MGDIYLPNSRSTIARLPAFHCILQLKKKNKFPRSAEPERQQGKLNNAPTIISLYSLPTMPRVHTRVRSGDGDDGDGGMAMMAVVAWR